MRLYRTGAGQWTGTQADARALAGKDWAEIEVPTDKPGLLAWLNDQATPPDTGRMAAPQPAAAPPAAAPPPAPAQAPLRPSLERVLAVEDMIAEADIPRASMLAHHCHCRIAELIRLGTGAAI